MASGNNYQRNRNNINVKEKRDPIVLNEDNYVKQAEEVIKKLVEQAEKEKDKILTTSKIRKLLALLSDMYTKARRISGDKLNSEMINRVQYFKLHAIYEAGREPAVRKFVEESQLIEQIDNIKGDKSRLILFCHYMEALVAYRKYLGGKDE